MPAILILRRAQDRSFETARKHRASSGRAGFRPPGLLRRRCSVRRLEGSKDGGLVSYAHRNGFRRCANRDISIQSPRANAAFFLRLHPLI